MANAVLLSLQVLAALRAFRSITCPLQAGVYFNKISNASETSNNVRRNFNQTKPDESASPET